MCQLVQSQLSLLDKGGGGRGEGGGGHMPLCPLPGSAYDVDRHSITFECMISGTKRDASVGLDPEGGGRGVIMPPFDFDNRSVTQTQSFSNSPVTVVLGCTCITGGKMTKPQPHPHVGVACVAPLYSEILDPALAEG